MGLVAGHNPALKAAAAAAAAAGRSHQAVVVPAVTEAVDHSLALVAGLDMQQADLLQRLVAHNNDFISNPIMPINTSNDCFTVTT